MRICQVIAIKVRKGYIRTPNLIITSVLKMILSSTNIHKNMSYSDVKFVSNNVKKWKTGTLTKCRMPSSIMISIFKIDPIFIIYSEKYDI